jgi:hypothetical protein
MIISYQRGIYWLKQLRVGTLVRRSVSISIYFIEIIILIRLTLCVALDDYFTVIIILNF